MTTIARVLDEHRLRIVDGPLPGGFYSVKFLEDATYLVARASDDEITVPDIGERAAHNLDA